MWTISTYTSSMQELIMQGMQQQLEKSCFCCKKNTWHVESNHILQPPKYLINGVNRLRYINNNFTKDRCSIPMDKTVVLGFHKFSLQVTMDHHGPSMYFGHYNTPTKCCKKINILLQRQQNYGVWNDWYKKRLYCLCGNIYIYWWRNVFLTRTVSITPMAPAHPLHPIRSRSKNKRRKLRVGWCVSSWRPWHWSV